MWFSIAVGQMGMTPEVFDDLTPAQFVYAQMGWLKNNERKTRGLYEVARYVAYYNLIINIEKVHRKPIDELLPLPWDKGKTKPEKLSGKELRERVDKALKIVENVNKDS